MSKPAVTPTATDILCGRGLFCFEHEGNQKFRALLALNLQAYRDANSRTQRSRVVRSVADTINVMGGRFLIFDGQTKTWRDGGKKKAVDKIGHSLRDAIANKSKNVEDLHRLVKEARERNELPPSAQPKVPTVSLMGVKDDAAEKSSTSSPRSRPSPQRSPTQSMNADDLKALPSIFIPERKLEGNKALLPASAGTMVVGPPQTELTTDCGPQVVEGAKTGSPSSPPNGDALKRYLDNLLDSVVESESDRDSYSYGSSGRSTNDDDDNNSNNNRSRSNSSPRRSDLCLPTLNKEEGLYTADHPTKRGDAGEHDGGCNSGKPYYNHFEGLQHGTTVTERTRSGEAFARGKYSTTRALVSTTRTAASHQPMMAAESQQLNGFTMTAFLGGPDPTRKQDTVQATFNDCVNGGQNTRDPPGLQASLLPRQQSWSSAFSLESLNPQQMPAAIANLDEYSMDLNDDSSSR